MRTFKKAGLSMLVVAALLVIGHPMSSWATPYPPVPEIDPSSAVSALALFSGAVVMIRAWRKK